MADQLSNAKLDELPKGGYIEPDDLLVFKSLLRGTTFSIPAKDLVPASSSNFQWVSTHSYNINEVVTYGGLWWQSQINANLGITPGSDDSKWLAVPKATGFGWWIAGVYDQAKTIVFSTNDGIARAYYLSVGVTLPFHSTDFAAELTANKWIPFTDQPGGGTYDNSTPGIYELDFRHRTDVVFAIANTGIDTELVFVNAGYATRMTFITTIGAEGVKIKFPNTFKMSDANWNEATQEWTLPAGQTGLTYFEAVNMGGIWVITKVITQLE